MDGIFLTVVLGMTPLGLSTGPGGVFDPYWSSSGPVPEFGRCGRSSQAMPSSSASSP